MQLAVRSWKIFCFMLSLVIVLLLVQLHMLTGYPTAWDKVQVGMTISHVRTLCGDPTYSSEGMKPDTWEKTLLVGKWVLKVGHDEIGQGPQSIVGSKEVLFVCEALAFRMKVNPMTRPPVQDWESFYKAFGQKLHPIAPATPSREAAGK